MPLDPNPYPFPTSAPDQPYIYIEGYENDDVLFAFYPDDFMYGHEGNDVLTGASGENWMYGGEGNDLIHGGAGGDVIFSEDGDDESHGDTGNDLIMGQGGRDRVFGGAGDDQVFGGDGNDLVDGGAGRDIIVADEGGIDQLTGGAGADVFFFIAFTSFTRLFNGIFIDSVDPITDFSQAEGDVIDVRYIDADPTAADDQAFTFIGSNPFTGVAGQLRAVISGGVTVVTADANGDRSPDSELEVRLTGAITLTAADFLL